MKIFKIENLPEEYRNNIGGKARGLNDLHSAGLDIAKGFIITDLKNDTDYNEAAEYYLASGLDKVAVRSSASAEDGVDFSGAGQYSTFLNVSGAEQFKKALRDCVASLDSGTASSYSKFFGAKSATMNIVVQEMIDPVFAGVCFTTDPVTGMKNILIEAVEGLGEKLVSGTAKSESYTVSRGEEDALNIETVGGSVSGGTLLNICGNALKAVAFFGCELDLEWAIDKQGKLFWLQARPITTLDEATIDELDSTGFSENAVFTNCNIGEMLPGAVTPLSLSISVRSIDEGCRRMLIKAGAYKSFDEIPSGACITNFNNHLFFNLTMIYKMATSIIAARKSDVESSICGKQLDNTPPLPFKMQNRFKRFVHFISYMRYLMSRKKAMRKIEELVNKLDIAYSPDLMQYYKNITAAIPEFNDITSLHYVTSAHSGAMSSTLLTMMKAEMPVDEVKALIAGVLEDIDDIESVDILRSMRRIGREALKKEPESVNFSWEKLSELIQTDSGALLEAYDYFIRRHGHRAIREAELRSISWEKDEKALMENILTVMQGGAAEPVKSASAVDEFRNKIIGRKKGLCKKGFNYIINQARAGVYSREYTKARFVRAVDRFKKAYNRLAGDMVEQGALPDRDLIFFLTHAEIGELIIDKKAKLIKRAMQRKRLLDEQREIKYNDVYIGKPEPVKQEDMRSADGEVLKGTPISRGEVKGYARVVKSVEDAKQLQKGEIMVASFTDIGWSPYYSVIGGLITEVGSALSHGAVVAREYALPLVVNVQNATIKIKTGDLILLNGSNGTVTIIDTKQKQGNLSENIADEDAGEVPAAETNIGFAMETAD